MNEPESGIEELLRAAVHDIRGPLGQLRALTGLLVSKHRDTLGEDGQQLCEFIEQAGARATTVVEALHAYARALAAPSMESVNMNHAFDAARSELASEIESRNGLVLAGALGCVCGDSRMIIQLLRELVANGLKFNASARPEIRISAVSEGAQMLYSATDNGIGIPMDRVEVVFKPLKRLNGFEYEGAGMGLTIAKRIVEAHGGQIWVASTASGGTDVRFTLQRYPPL